MTSFRTHMKRKKRRQMISNVMKHCLQPITVVSLCAATMLYLTDPIRLVGNTRIHVHEKYPEVVAENDMKQEESNEVLVNLDNASKGIISNSNYNNINEFQSNIFTTDVNSINLVNESIYSLDYFKGYENSLYKLFIQKQPDEISESILYIEDKKSVTSSGDESIYVDECIVESMVKEDITIIEKEIISNISPKDIIVNVQNVSVKSGATPEMIECALKGTWLEGYGQLYYDLEQQYGINAFIAIANAIQETGWDIKKSNKAMNHNNIYGIVNGHYDSLEECITYYFDLISRKYVNKGYKSLQAINTRYCPPDDSWSYDIGKIAKGLNNKVATTF